MHPRSVIALASALMALGVGLGAFGAHGLASLEGITAKNLDTWDTAVFYHLLHALALLIVGVHANVSPTQNGVVVVLFVLGITLFSGSLYGLVLGAPGWLGPITPLGGTCLIIGWLMLGYKALAQPGGSNG